MCVYQNTTRYYLSANTLFCVQYKDEVRDYNMYTSGANKTVTMT